MANSVSSRLRRGRHVTPDLRRPLAAADMHMPLPGAACPGQAVMVLTNVWLRSPCPYVSRPGRRPRSWPLFAFDGEVGYWAVVETSDLRATSKKVARSAEEPGRLTPPGNRLGGVARPGACGDGRLPPTFAGGGSALQLSLRHAAHVTHPSGGSAAIRPIRLSEGYKVARDLD